MTLYQCFLTGAAGIAGGLIATWLFGRSKWLLYGTVEVADEAETFVIYKHLKDKIDSGECHIKYRGEDERQMLIRYHLFLHRRAMASVWQYPKKVDEK